MPRELRVLFARDGDDLTFRLLPSWAPEPAPARPFVPFMTSQDRDDLRWYLEDYMDLPISGALVRAKRVEQSLKEWGRRLFDAVLGDGSLLDGAAPCMLTIAAQDVDVHRIPWELMADSRGPLTLRGVTIRRQLDSPRRPPIYQPVTLPLRILLVVSRPDDAGFIDPRNTTRAMLDALDPLGGDVVVDFCRPATVRRMQQMLDAANDGGRPYHIVHFDGHGSFLPETQMGVLYFEEDGGARKVPPDRVTADRFGQMLAKHRIGLAILEACRTGTPGRGSTASRLIEAGVGSVVAMSHEVHVEAATILLRRFYERLVQGATVGQAMEQGRAALMDQPNRWRKRGPGEEDVALQDWFLPTLYQSGEDPALVPPDEGETRRPERSTCTATARREPATGQVPGAFPGPPRCGFAGRARDLQQLERRFSKRRAVVLHGMPGMGKTALAREAAWWFCRTGLFPDGACFVSFEQAGGAVRAVQALGASFDGVTFERRPQEEQKTRARELFQTKKVLVVWDNFESVLPAFQEGEAVMPYPPEEQAAVFETLREWTANPQGEGRLLLTCRPEETGLDEVVSPFELKALDGPDARTLLYQVMQRAGVENAYPREDLLDLLETTMRNHPLSIELLGRHLKSMAPAQITKDYRALLEELAGEATEERNRSLRASLQFSLRRLSHEAREAVEWMGLFRGGVFEQVLLDVSRMDPAALEKARGELEATALLRVEWDPRVNERPYLRFHPALGLTGGDDDTVDVGVRSRYVAVYLMLARTVDRDFHGSNPRRGLEVVTREEASFRRAAIWAMEGGADSPAAMLADTLRGYLERSGRLRERDRWAARLSEGVSRDQFSYAVVVAEMNEARALLSRGETRKAVEKSEALVARLRATTELDPITQHDTDFALALACGTLGRVYHAVGWAQKATLVQKDGVRRWEVLEEKARVAGKSAHAARGNLAAALGELANTLCAVDALEEALAAVERAIAINREDHDARNLASNLGQSAWVLWQMGRSAEADARYDEALRFGAGDRETEAATLQQQGGLAAARGQLDRAARLYRRALGHFQQMRDEGAITRTYRLLGEVEDKAGRFDEARAWYEGCREIAVSRGDRRTIGAATFSLGILCQREGQAARERGDDAQARERFAEAARHHEETLAAWGDQQGIDLARVHNRLGQVQLLLGDLDKAEEHAQKARKLCEDLGAKEAWLYDTLAAIARARGPGQEAEVAAWEQKRDALRAEPRGRPSAFTLPQKGVEGIARLALVCAHVGRNGQPLGVLEEEALAKIASWPDPFHTLAPFLRALAAGQRPAVPADLPRELREVLEPHVRKPRRSDLN